MNRDYTSNRRRSGSPRRSRDRDRDRNNNSSYHNSSGYHNSRDGGNRRSRSRDRSRNRNDRRGGSREHRFGSRERRPDNGWHKNTGNNDRNFRDNGGRDNGRGFRNNNNNLSFRFPRHQTPELVAHTYNYQPYVSLKIDGFFHSVPPHKHRIFYPPFPNEWTDIEGELFRQEGKPPIFYVFKVKVDGKELPIHEMIVEIQNYFENQTNLSVKRPPSESDNDDVASWISEDLLTDIHRSFAWRDKNPVRGTPRHNFDFDLQGTCWYPKRYWPLCTRRDTKSPIENWNYYIEQIERLLSFVHSRQVLDVIPHDGLVFTPDVCSRKTSLMKWKPKNELTIDLRFFSNKQRPDGRNGGVFCAFDGEDCSFMVVSDYNSSDFEDQSVYRLYPNNEDLFVPNVQGKREPGKKANSLPHVMEIYFKLKNYFNINQLYDICNTPWYDQVDNSRMNEMMPLFKFSQVVYKTILPRVAPRGRVLDLGCGSCGQYARILDVPEVTDYIGLDIDLAKLHEGESKLNFNNKYSFVLFDISKPWTIESQNQSFPHDIWKTYYHAKVKAMIDQDKTGNDGSMESSNSHESDALSDNKNMKSNECANIDANPFDAIISIFSSQYANTSPETWDRYVMEINTRSKTNTVLFIEFIDCDRVDKENPSNELYTFQANEADNTRGELTVRLPTRPEHTEPALSYSTIIESFCGLNNVEDKVNEGVVTHRWEIARDLATVSDLPNMDDNCPMTKYIRLVNWVVLRKL